MLRNLFLTKSVDTLKDEAGAPDHSLRRSLRAIDLLMLGVGAIVGVGIFVLTGQAAATYAGPAVVLSFLLAGMASAFAGLCYSEMAAMIPVSGSAYTYSYATLGELVAWIIGWDLVLEYSLACATVSVGWSGYFASLLRDFGIAIPARFASAPYTYDAAAHRWMTTGSILNIPAVAIVLLVTALLVIGIRESANANSTIVVVKLAVIAIFIVAGALYVHRSNWTPFLPPNTGRFGEYGWTGVLRAAGVVFVAYIGFDAVSTAAQESTDPQRDMPIGIIGSLAACAVLYVLVAGVLTGMVPYSTLNVPDPIAVGINATRLSWLKPVVKIGAVAGLSSVILVMLLGQSRIFWCMAGDGLLPGFLSRVHSKFRTPYVTTLVTGSVVAIAGGLFPVGILAELVSIGTLFAFVLVCGGVWVMRHTRPEIPRPFRAPWVPFTPLLGIGSCVYLMYGLPSETWIRLFTWMAIGLVVYFSYGRTRSKVANAFIAKAEATSTTL